MSIEEIEAEALKLDSKSRARLAEKLLESLEQLSECVFRTNAIGDFGRRRSLISVQGDRSFRAWRSPISVKPIACFGQGDH